MKRNFIIYLSILCLCLITGLVVLSLGQVFEINGREIQAPKSTFFHAIDTGVFRETSKAHHGKNLHPAPYDGRSKKRDLLAKNKPNNMLDLFQEYTFDDDPQQHFSEVPPTPIDLAIILEELKLKGVQHLFLSTQLTWEDADEIDLGVLYSEGLNGFKTVTVTAPLTRSQSPKPIPSIFEKSSIAQSQINGNLNLIPEVNSAPVPLSLEFPPQTLAGFSKVDFELHSNDQPYMLAKWNDRFVLGFALIAFIQKEQIPLDTIQVELGKHIMLGHPEMKIPINDSGQIDLRGLAYERNSIVATEVLAQMDLDNPSLTFAPSALITATGEKTSSVQAVKKPFQQLCFFFSIQRPAFNRSYKRLPLWIEAIILCEVTLLCSIFYGMRSSNRNIVYLLSIPIYFILLTALISIGQYWTPASPPLTVLITGWIFTTFTSKYYPIRRQTTRIEKKVKKALLERFE